MEDAVQQSSDDADGAAEAKAQRHEADVLARGVRKLALQVVLSVHGHRRDNHGQSADDQHDQLRELGTDRLARKHVEADDHKQGALQKNAGQQRGHGAGGLGVSVGQPGVHREQTRLGAEADDGEHEGDAHEHRVELMRNGQDGRPQNRVGRVGQNGVGVSEREHGGVQAEGNACGADDDVLPASFQRELLLAVSGNQEDGRKRGGLNRSPHHDDVVRQRSHEHGEHEQAEEHVVDLSLALVQVAGLDVMPDVGNREQAGHAADDADQDHEDRSQRVHVEPLRQGEDVVVRGHDVQGKEHAQHADNHDGHGMQGLVHSNGGRLRRDDRHNNRGDQRDEQKQLHKVRKFHHPPSPSVPSNRRRQANA